MSFVQRFGLSKKEGGGNSVQREVILETMKEAQENLAELISQETSASGNMDAVLTRNSKNLAPNIEAEESLIEQEIEANSIEHLLKAIERTSSPEELAALLQHYETLLQSWSEKVALLRNEKHLKEYLSIIAALSMLQKIIQQPELLGGKQLSDMVQSSLTSQQQVIEHQTNTLQTQNHKLHEQKQQLIKRLSGIELSLQTAIEGLRKDAGKLPLHELQQTVKQLQETLKQVQTFKEKAENGKPLEFKEIIEGLQKSHQHQQRLIENSPLSSIALQSIVQLQQGLHHTLQQTHLVQKLQENISKLHTVLTDQVRQSASSFIQAQLTTLSIDKIPSIALPPEVKGQREQLNVPSITANQNERMPDLLQKTQEVTISRGILTQHINLVREQITTLGLEKPITPLLSPETKGLIPPEQKLPLSHVQPEYTKDRNILLPQTRETVSVLSAKIHETHPSQEIAAISKPTQQQVLPERMTIKNNVIDISLRLQERTGIENSAYKPLSKDVLSQGHVCTGSCHHGALHEAHQPIQPKMMGQDIVSKAHVCTGPDCCGKAHNHQQSVLPKAMGIDIVSKAHAHGPGCGCSSCNHTHHPKPSAQPHKYEHGPSCSCCGHGAKATEIGRSQQVARVS